MLVWYAAYGSNLLAERFSVYLRGGSVPGAGRSQHGARDPSDPVEWRPYRIDRPMRFGFRSTGWNGTGVCLVEPERVAPADTYARAWLITVEQLTDVWAQENGQRVGPALDLDRLRVDGRADFGSGRYRRLEYLGALDGAPVVTITCDRSPPPNPAGAPYLEVVGRGLMETWGLSAGEAARYLATRVGNAGTVDAGGLTRALGADRPDPLHAREDSNPQPPGSKPGTLSN